MFMGCFRCSDGGSSVRGLKVCVVDSWSSLSKGSS